MDFIWILLGMPIVCGLFSIYLVLRDRVRENGRRKRAGASPMGVNNAKYSVVGVLQKGKVKTS
jgi:hypothetical protein